MASCGGCGEGRASRAYAQWGGADGDWVMKVYDEANIFGVTALPESEVASKVCGAGNRWSNGKCELEAHFQAYEGSSRFDPAQLVCQTRDCAFAYLRSVASWGNDWTICRNGQVQPAAYVQSDCQLVSQGNDGGACTPAAKSAHGCREDCSWSLQDCCTRRDFEPGSRPTACLHALPAPPPAPRPAAGARRARRATRSRAAARRGEDVVTGHGKGGWPRRVAGMQTPGCRGIRRAGSL